MHGNEATWTDTKAFQTVIMNGYYYLGVVFIVRNGKR